MVSSIKRRLSRMIELYYVVWNYLHFSLFAQALCRSKRDLDNCIRQSILLHNTNTSIPLLNMLLLEKAHKPNDVLDQIRNP
jgi:hypothetical protein